MFALLFLLDRFFGIDPNEILLALVILLIQAAVPPALLALVGWLVARTKPTYSLIVKSAVLCGLLGYGVGICLLLTSAREVTLLLVLGTMAIGLVIGVLVGVLLKRRQSPAL